MSETREYSPILHVLGSSARPSQTVRLRWIQFSGTNDTLHKRHLLFDVVVPPAAPCPHARFRAVAGSVKDVLR